MPRFYDTFFKFSKLNEECKLCQIAKEKNWIYEDGDFQDNEIVYDSNWHDAWNRNNYGTDLMLSILSLQRVIILLNKTKSNISVGVIRIWIRLSDFQLLISVLQKIRNFIKNLMLIIVMIL